LAEGVHSLREFVHPGDGQALDHYVRGMSEQMPALFCTAHRPVVIGAAVPAGHADGSAREVAQFLERIHEALIDLGLAATPAGELALREIPAQISHMLFLLTASARCPRRWSPSAAALPSVWAALPG